MTSVTVATLVTTLILEVTSASYNVIMSATPTRCRVRTVQHGRETDMSRPTATCANDFTNPSLSLSNSDISMLDDVRSQPNYCRPTTSRPIYHNIAVCMDAGARSLITSTMG